MKRAFTLVELLAVIVILGVIALVATPIVIDIIDDSKDSVALDEAKNLVRDIDDYCKLLNFNMKDKMNSDTTIDCENMTKDNVASMVHLGNTEVLDVDYKSNKVVRLLIKNNDRLVYYDGTDYSIKSSADINVKYTIRRSLTSTSSAWERYDNAVGKVANATKDGSSVVNDFDNIYPWSAIKSYVYDRDLNQDVADISEAKYHADGSTGDVLTRIPIFYYKRWQSNGYEYISISEFPISGYTKSDAFSVGRYTSSYADNKIRSMSGVAPAANQTMTWFRTKSEAIDKGFGQLDYHYFLIQILYLVEYADYNSQAKLGLGVSSSSTILPSGGCDSLGMKSGTLNNDGKHSMIYRGMEDIFGNIWQFIDGINLKNNVAYVCTEPEEYNVDTYTGCYKMLSYINAKANGTIKTLGYDDRYPLFSFPTETGSVINDGYRQAGGSYITLVGGRWDYGNSNGLYYYALDTGSVGLNSIGSRILRTK